MDIWFQDEARVGQKGTLTRVWAERGTRPRLTRQQQYESAYVFGAVCPSQDQAVGLVMPRVNTEAMQDHLALLSEQVPTGRHAVVVLDRAGWHTTTKLKAFENISLLPLPPYSPELNPTEQVWAQLRSRSLGNRCFKNYDDIVQASCEAWNAFVGEEGAVQKLCSRAWATLQH